MQNAIWIPTLTVLTGGMLTGAFALPMKLARRWQWENIWLLYSVSGLILVPWIAAWATVPELGQVYDSVPAKTLCVTALFGFGWGIANVLFGLSVALIGMALTFAIVGGMSAAVGSLIPLIILTPERLGTAAGKIVILGVIVTVIGVALVGKAGRMREKALKQAGEQTSIGLGLLLSIAAGLMGPMLNFSFAFGSRIAEEAAKRGASASSAAHAIWAIALIGGFAGNGGYAILKLTRERTWSKFPLGALGSEWTASAVMGVMFTAGLLLYGRGASALGDLGPAIGWPVFQATTIIIAAIIGAASGEWRNAGSRFVGLTVAGMAVLVAAIVVLSIGNRA